MLFMRRKLFFTKLTVHYTLILLIKISLYNNSLAIFKAFDERLSTVDITADFPNQISILILLHL